MSSCALFSWDGGPWAQWEAVDTCRPPLTLGVFGPWGDFLVDWDEHPFPGCWHDIQGSVVGFSHHMKQIHAKIKHKSFAW